MNRRSLLLTGAAAGAAFSWERAMAAADTIEAVVADYERFTLAQDPVTAGQLGNRQALKRWPDDSPAAVAARQTQLEAFHARLAALSGAALPAEAAINRDFLIRQVDLALAGLAFDEERMPFVADDGFFNLPDYVARGTTIKSAADADAWLDRLSAVAGFYETEMANARRGVATGFVQPGIVLDAALTTVRPQAAAKAEDSSLLLPLASLPADMPAPAQASYRAKALTIVREQIKPAQRSLQVFLETGYRPKAQAREVVGLCGLPGGLAYYAYLSRRYTTTTMTPEAIHALGVKEVARIRADMDATIVQTGFKGDFPAFLTFLRTDPRFYATSREALLERARTLAARIDRELPKWFGHLPKLPYEVRPAPAELEESYTSGRYWEGSPEQGTPGIYIVNTSHLDQRPLFELPVLTLHEAIPGHHTQIALAQENKALPVFRRGDGLTAYVEGWALYTERLGVEMGIYQDAYERFGMLSFDMWRACRLVVDTGLHQMAWPRAKARAFLADNTALSQKNVDVEIDRYIGQPGQALAYKIGQLKILELRARAEAALGGRFDIRAFHDVILDEGPLPLDMLEARVDAWIGRLKAT